eukprot:COSAG02_NODE_4462_length_5335_cov_42.590718_3_plen_660_part_00
MVEAFAAHRPLLIEEPVDKLCGLTSWHLESGDECSQYVHNEIDGHLRGIGLDLCAEVPECVKTWLCHYPQENELIVNAVRKLLGLQGLIKVAENAARVGDDWLVHMASWSFLNENNRLYGPGHIWYKGSPVHHRLESFWPGPLRRLLFEPKTECPRQLTAREYEHFVLHECLTWEWLKNFSGGSGHDIAEWSGVSWWKEEYTSAGRKRLIHILENTEIGRAHKKDAAKVSQDEETAKHENTGNFSTLDPIEMTDWRQDTQEKLLVGDSRKLLTALTEVNPRWFRLPEWSWDLLESIDFVAALHSFDFAHETKELAELGGPPRYAAFLALISAVRGDLDVANQVLDYRAELDIEVLKAIEDRKQYQRAGAVDHFGTRAVHYGMPWVLCMLGRTADAEAMMNRFGLTWTTAQARADAVADFDDPFTRKRGAQVSVYNLWSAEDWHWSTKLQYVLCTTWREVASADVIATLPSPEVLEAHIAKVNPHPGRSASITGPAVLNLLLLAAEVCEKLERPADALLYLDRALRVDPHDPATDIRPITRAVGLALRGRMLTAIGKREEGKAAFEEAIEVSHRTGLRLLEMFALRDLLNAHTCSQPLVHGSTSAAALAAPDHDDDVVAAAAGIMQQLQAVLKEMKGPTSELTRLLGSGLDAEEILRRPS